MPGFDGTGPRGAGPMSGGARGYCAVPAGAAALGRGFGRGLRRAGGGFGFGRAIRGSGFGVRAGGSGGAAVPMPAQAERADLQEQAQWLQQQLDRIQQRIDELNG